MIKKFAVFSIVFVICLLTTSFVIAAGPSADVTTILIDVPICKSITIEVTNLSLIGFRVDGQNVYKPFFYSTIEAPRAVELRVRGNGVIDLRTNNGYQWIAVVMNGEIFALPQPDNRQERVTILPKGSGWENPDGTYEKKVVYGIKTSNPFSDVRFIVKGAEIEEVDTAAKGSLISYLMPKRNEVSVFLNNTGPAEEEAVVVIKAIGPSSIQVLLNGEEAIKSAYIVPGSGPPGFPPEGKGAPRKNPPTKGKLSTTWGNIKSKG